MKKIIKTFFPWTKHPQTPSNLPDRATSNISLITSGPSRAYDFTPFDSVKMTIGSVDENRGSALLGKLVGIMSNT